MATTDKAKANDKANAKDDDPKGLPVVTERHQGNPAPKPRVVQDTPPVLKNETALEFLDAQDASANTRARASAGKPDDPAPGTNLSPIKLKHPPHGMADLAAAYYATHQQLVQKTIAAGGQAAVQVEEPVDCQCVLCAKYRDATGD